MPVRSAGAVLVDTLASLGARSFYTVPGESFLEVLDAAQTDNRIRLISTRHESGASFMASAEGKLTGLPAVAMATRAPGACNLAVGIHTAFHDSTPLIALIGQVDSNLSGLESFQEIDLPGFYRPITKWSASLRNPARAAELAYRAFVAATTGRPGPVLIEMPSDVLAEASPQLEVPLASANLPQTFTAPSSAVISQIREMIQRAERPVVIAGGGAQSARSELIELTARYGVGVYAAFRRQDVFPNDHSAYLGHLTIGASDSLLTALRQSDLVLALGCRLSEITTQGFQVPARTVNLVHVDIQASSIGAGSCPSLAVVADVRATLQALLADAVGPAIVRDWSAAHQAYLDVTSSAAASVEQAGIHPVEVVCAMRKVFPEDSIIASDAGNFSIFLHRYWRFLHPSTQLAPTSGAMGYGVPAAVAAKLCRPNRSVVAVAGDGGFLMTGQELETAVRYGAAIVVVVFRNGMYGTIAMHQLREFGVTAGTDIGDVDLASYARGLGAVGYTVRHSHELTEALEQAVSANRPAVVDVVVDPDVITPELTLSAIRSRFNEKGEKSEQVE